MVKDLTTDTTSPVIELIGEDVITVEAMSEYIETGATAYDEMDGEVDVIIEGSVDTSTLGTYVISYHAIDRTGNSVTKTRTILVLDRTKPTITLSGEKEIHIFKEEEYVELGAMAYDVRW